MNKVKEFYKERQKQVKISYRKVHLIELIKPYVENRKVYDIGCGDGLIAASLAFFCNMVAFDLDTEKAARRFKGLKFVDFNMVTDHSVPIGADFVLCLDVLEHIPEENESTVLARLAQMGDNVIINLPEQSTGDQIIEREIELTTLIRHFKPHKLRLRKLLHWRVSDEERYNFMVFLKDE